MVPEEDMCYSCFEATKYSCIKCTNCNVVICNRCSAFESNEETPGWIAGEESDIVSLVNKKRASK